ncbi:Protein CBG02416 [Caenorhabditis briggsae]|uniref:Protein CBG02416 n=1 Tax=Caenorhabditis briggsae TaxID=6238 RepID=A8WUD2_CAEBR|nr:Protein CBG02416 [Caenorhabditis briggsae]CAP24094.2 Protein CBG02416 [Caenorhabditis briggsae]
MFPRKDGPKFKKGNYSETQKRPSSFQSVKPANRTFSSNEETYFRRRKKPHVLAGMFANAKSSVHVAPASHLQISPSKHPVVSKSFSESPKRVSKIFNLPKAQLSQTWDFSDVTERNNSNVPTSKRLNSDEEYPKKTPTTSSHKKPVIPWMRIIPSDSESSSYLKPKKTGNFEYPDGFETTIARFSSRLDQIGALPTLPLQNHTDTTMGKVEKALMTVALAQTKENDCKKSIPVFDVMVERSDWLIFREDFNDETDHPPTNPFYSHDVISRQFVYLLISFIKGFSDYEEYEQQKEDSNKPLYKRLLSTEERKSVEKEMSDSPDPLDFLKESDSPDRQEDFFNLNMTKTSEMSYTPNFNQIEEFPTFTQFFSTSNHNQRKIKMSSDQSTTQMPGTPAKLHQDVHPRASGGYSPFNFALVTSRFY